MPASRGLEGLGARVQQVAAYRTVTPEEAGGQGRELLESGVDVVTFTSSSTVRNLLGLLDGNKQRLESSLIACIGPITAKTARESGLRVDLVAEENTVEGLVDVLARHFAEQTEAGRD